MLDSIIDVNVGEEIRIWKLYEKKGTFFTSKMAIDADGSPRAYHPSNILGLDDICTQGRYGIAQREVNGVKELFIQDEYDPCPGYYVSQTSLYDATKEDWDPSKYVNSEKIPYIVLPPQYIAKPKAVSWKMNFGDFGVVINLKNRRVVYVMVAEDGPVDKIGEGSIALANALGVPSNPRKGGTDGEAYIFYLLFPGSGVGNGQLRSLAEINANGEEIFREWGGIAQVEAIHPYTLNH
jgi:hypothetical protein